MAHDSCRQKCFSQHFSRTTIVGFQRASLIFSYFLDRDTLPPPTVKVQGYNVEVTFDPPKACFRPQAYDISLKWSPLCDHSRMVDGIPAIEV